MSFPQLRVRSEYSFRNNYGPVKTVSETLASMGAPAAGMVDTKGTWSHVTWSKALLAADVSPLYGTELTIPFGEDDERKPRCWVLATDLAAFYRLSSQNPTTQEELAAATGVLRFAGAALTDPEAFDYIDINPRSRMATRRALALHKKTGKPIVITSDADYPRPQDRDRFLGWDDSKKMTPQHLLTERELRDCFNWLPGDIVEAAIRSTHEAAERASGLKLRTAPIISVPGDLPSMVEEGRKMRLARGHIAE